MAFQIEMILELGPGPHVAVQRELLRSTVARLRAAGTEVILAETPLHPEAASLYDQTLRADFLRFAGGLEREYGVRLLRLEEYGGFAASDFSDLLHLHRDRAIQYTRTIVEAVGELLGMSQVGERQARETSERD